MIALLENISVALVTLLHISFLILEMFLWTKPVGRNIFKLKKEYANQTSALAANQGLYNGFLAAGLIWSFIDTSFSFELRVFFLSCIIIAGIFGAITVNRMILWIQAFPALIALTLVYINQI